MTESTACGNGGGCGDQLGTVRSQLAAIYNQYPTDSFQCNRAANATLEAFQNAGMNGELVRIEDRFEGNYLMDQNGNRIADVGWHEAVRVGDRYYDALTGPEGATWDEYQKLFYKDGWEYIRQVPSERRP